MNYRDLLSYHTGSEVKSWHGVARDASKRSELRLRAWEGIEARPKKGR